MKRHSFIIALMAGFFAMTSCQDKDWETPEGLATEPPYGNNTLVAGTTTTIAQLQSKYASVISNSSYQQITDDLWLRCVVTGNDFGGNIYKQISVQDETGGIIIGINGSDQGALMPVGQKLLISLKDLCIGCYGQQAQIGDEYNGSIGRMSTKKWEEHVRILPSHDMSQIDTLDFDIAMDKNRYAGHLVRLKDVMIGDADGTTTLAPEYKAGTTLTYNGSTNGYVHHSLNGESMNALVLRTSTYADFASLVIPTEPVTLYGIATRYNSTWQILIRAADDIKVNEK